MVTDVFLFRFTSLEKRDVFVEVVKHMSSRELSPNFYIETPDVNLELRLFGTLPQCLDGIHGLTVCYGNMLLAEDRHELMTLFGE